MTSTYFAANRPFGEDRKQRFGYSRDKRPDCVQIVIPLAVTPEGLPLASEVLRGNGADSTTGGRAYTSQWVSLLKRPNPLS